MNISARVCHVCYVGMLISAHGSVSPGWMSRVALQDAVPAGLTAVTQYDPTLLGLICFISRL